MKPLVLYHGGGCRDGFCSAWVARKALGEIEAIPVQYGQDPPIDYCGRDVYILDFSYPRAVLKNMIGQSMFVMVLDHHETAQADLEGLVEECVRENIGLHPPVIHFDMNKSGGRLAWEYFFPSLKSSWLVDYTEDRDLWRHKLPNTREVNANLRSMPLDFNVWDLLYDLNSNDSMKSSSGTFVIEGAAILRAERQIINDHLGRAREINLDGRKIKAVNATVLVSEIAGELAKGMPFGACYFDREDGKRIWSLRSASDGLDVSEIAKRHGGGGHRNAAGFEEDGA